MDKNFTTLLKQFLDCYVADPLAVEIHLGNAQQDIDSGTFREPYERDGEAKLLSEEGAYRALRNRLLSDQPDKASPDNPSAESVVLRPTAPAEQFSFERWREESFQAFLNRLAWALDIPREELDRLNAENGITREQLYGLQRDPEWQKKEAEYAFEVDSQPNLQVVLAREFAEWLDVAVAKIEQIGEVSYRDTLPDHLKRYVQQAYRCDLYGFDAACAALCGSILQEAIRFKLGSQGFTGLREAIDEAEKSGALTPKAVEAAEEIMRIRNLAAHGRQKFTDSPEDRRKSSLPLTREILDTLFAVET